MAPVFMFSVFCSTDGTSFHVFGTLLVPSVEQSIENMKTGAIGGEESLKHKNWCHQWSRVPKTICSTDDTSFHVFGTLLH
jgi:hypothetical protein